jgi:hypothetical protein
MLLLVALDSCTLRCFGYEVLDMMLLVALDSCTLRCFGYEILDRMLLVALGSCTLRCFGNDGMDKFWRNAVVEYSFCSSRNAGFIIQFSSTIIVHRCSSIPKFPKVSVH